MCDRSLVGPHDTNMPHHLVHLRTIQEGYTTCFENYIKKRKEKITPVFYYRRECEPVNLVLIIAHHDAI